MTKRKSARYVVSARPGTVIFVEAGVEFSRPAKEWEPLTEKSQLETGDKLRTSAHTFAELTMLPDINLRIDSKSEILFEELSNESISLKLLQGSAILDVARFDRKEGPQIRTRRRRRRLSPSQTTEITGSISSQMAMRSRFATAKCSSKDDRLAHVEKSPGKQFLIAIRRERQFRRSGVIIEAKASSYDGDDVSQWSRIWIELRRVRFRNTGFWFQNPGKTHYTFVPFYFAALSFSIRRQLLDRSFAAPCADDSSRIVVQEPFGRVPSGPDRSRGRDHEFDISSTQSPVFRKTK